MNTKELEDLHTSLTRLRQNIKQWEMFKCIDAVDLFYRTGYASTRFSSSTDALQIIRNSLVAAKGREITGQYKALRDAGVDALNEVPKELQA